MPEPTIADVDALVGPATPQFAYQLRARVLEEYSWERITDKTEELYQSLLQRVPVRVG